MVRKDEGVVLKSARSGETSKHVTFLGRDSGKVKLLAKGALSPKSPFVGLLEPGNRLEILYYYKEGRSLFFLKEVHVHSSLQSRAGSLDGLAASLAVLEVLDQVCYWGSPDHRVVDLVTDHLACKPAADPVLFFLAFEFKLLDVLGSLPEIRACSECGSLLEDGYYHPEEGSCRCRTHTTSVPHRIHVDAALLDLIAVVGERSFAQIGELEVDAGLRKRLGQVLHWTYTFHIHGYRLPEALKLIPKREQ